MEIDKIEAQIILDILNDLKQVPQRADKFENKEEILQTLLQARVPMFALYTLTNKLKEFVAEGE